MNFISNREDLLFAVQTVQRAVSPKNPLPILSGIKFETEGDLLIVSATDLEIGIKCSVKAEILENGSAVLPARYITELIRRLPDVPVFIKSDSLTGSVTVNYGRSETVINGFPVEEFPDLQIPAYEVGFDISEDILKEVIRQVVFAAGTDENRPVFTGVLLEINEGEMQMVATDTHRLAWRKLKLKDCGGIYINVIVPGKTLNELGRIIGQREKLVRVTLNDNQIFFDMGNVCLVSRLISGKYPSFHHVIPQEPVCRVRLKTRELAESAERAALLIPESTPVIKLFLEDDTLVISVSTAAGRVYEEIPVYQEGEPVQVAFNARYLIEILKVIECDEIDIEFSGPLSPGIIRPAGDKDYLYLLLPVRIRED